MLTWEWLVANKTWVFDGVGIAVLALFAKAFVALRKRMSGSGAASHLTMSLVGKEHKIDPTTMCVGIDRVLPECFIEVPLLLHNGSAAPIANIAVRVEIPTQLSPPDFKRSMLPTGESTYSMQVGGTRNQRTYQLPNLRLDETVVVPVLLRVAAADWITVPVGKPREVRGNLALTKIGDRTPLSVLILRVTASVHADNARSITRRFDLWIVPSRDQDELEEVLNQVAMVAQIWRNKHRAFVLPSFGSFAFMPRFPNRLFFEQCAVVHVRSRKVMFGSHATRLFDVAEARFLTPAYVYRHLVANPQEERAVFRAWIDEIFALKPSYL